MAGAAITIQVAGGLPAILLCLSSSLRANIGLSPVTQADNLSFPVRFAGRRSVVIPTLHGILKVSHGNDCSTGAATPTWPHPILTRFLHEGQDSLLSGWNLAFCRKFPGRVHRAISWFGRAEAAGGDDARFLFLRIGSTRPTRTRRRFRTRRPPSGTPSRVSFGGRAPSPTSPTRREFCRFSLFSAIQVIE